jgi:adenylosuccinate lyase
MDIEDNTNILRLRAALEILLQRLSYLLKTMSLLIEKWTDTPIMALTLLQPAGPSTLGYRLTLYGQDLLQDYQGIRNQAKGIKGKGF